LVHLTSYKVNRGYEEIKRLSKNRKIKMYIITGRYGFLKDDYERWLKRIQADKVFEACYINEENIQPNDFKEQMIKRLKLDIYVEDNWDIIEKLNHHTGAEILWITNLVDKRIPYTNKFNDLKGVFLFLKKHLSRRS
jgi:hypothetical protein